MAKALPATPAHCLVVRTLGKSVSWWMVSVERQLSHMAPAQAAGARAVPILCDAPAHEVERIFKAVNGLLIPGGGQNLSPGHPFYDTAAELFRMTLAANDAGDYMPVGLPP